MNKRIAAIAILALAGWVVVFILLFGHRSEPASNPPPAAPVASVSTTSPVPTSYSSSSTPVPTTGVSRAKLKASSQKPVHASRRTLTPVPAQAPSADQPDSSTPSSSSVPHFP